MRLTLEQPFKAIRVEGDRRRFRSRLIGSESGPDPCKLDRTLTRIELRCRPRVLYTSELECRRSNQRQPYVNRTRRPHRTHRRVHLAVARTDSKSPCTRAAFTYDCPRVDLM